MGLRAGLRGTRDMKRRSWRRRALGVMAVFATVALAGGGPARAEARNPKGVALIIGNGDYEHRDVPDVKYAHRDAEAFKRYVLDVLGFDSNNVIDLRDATRREMNDALGTRRDARSDVWAHLHPRGGSDVVVFYSGHGVPGTRDKRGYLLPVDADPKAAEQDGYPIDLLYTNLAKLTEARSVRVYLDACFSGGSAGGGLIRDASPVYVSAELPQGTGEKVTSLSAATGKQIASWDGEARHGLFTHHLLDALYGKGDVDKDGKVTAREAKEYLDDWMTRAARRKHRRIQEASLLGGDEVVLAAAPAGGVYPERPVLGAGTGGARAVARTGSDRDRSGGPASPKAPASGRREKPGPDHAAVERGLSLDREGKVLVQRGLAAMKYDVGYADGLFGKRTRGAIRKWQEAKGFEGTGYLTMAQAKALKAVGEGMRREREERERKAREKAKQERDAREAAERERLAREARERAERERMRPGRVFRDCEGCPEMVVVPAGEYMMGSPSDEEGRYSNEGPRHRVRIPRAFAVGKYEVTFEEWDACVAEGGCMAYRPEKLISYIRLLDSLFPSGWGRLPVTEVSWEDTKGYVKWLSDKTGKDYRLLTEAEWEYVARAGTEGPFHTGSTITPDREYGFRWKTQHLAGTTSVGRFPANGFGLHDVHGNAREWVEDCWHGDYSGAPTDGSAWVSGGDCGRRVVRGGSWVNDSRDLRSASRFRYSVSDRSNRSGFRIARTLTP